MELIRILLALVLLTLPALAQTSTVNPNIPVPGTPVEQSGPALRQNFQATVNDINALWAARGRTPAAGAGNIQLFANFATGSDAAGNLCAQATPCKTVQHAYDVLSSLIDTTGRNTVISFTQPDTACLNMLKGWTGGGTLTLNGPGGSPPSAGFTCPNACIVINTNLTGNFFVNNLALTCGSHGIWHAGTGIVGINNLNFGTIGGGDIVASSPGGQVFCFSGYTVTGNAQSHYNAVSGGSITCANVRVAIPSPVSFTGAALANSDTLALLVAPNIQFCTALTGVCTPPTVTGRRYFINVNAVINTQSSNPSYFPGTIAGLTQLGGQYQ